MKLEGFNFLEASSHPYMRVCQSVCPTKTRFFSKCAQTCVFDVGRLGEGKGRGEWVVTKYCSKQGESVRPVRLSVRPATIP